MSKNTNNRPFWLEKKLIDMSASEWESLCDGCARCCLNKLEDEDTNELFWTDAACRFLDQEACRCTDYVNRSTVVPECIQLTPGNVGALDWMPPTCAYRLLAAGKDLPDWHPLVTGDPDSVHKAGISVRGRVVSEADVEDLEDRVVDWIEDLEN